MKMIPTYQLEPEEFQAVRRIMHLVGYCLEGPERGEEIRAANCLFRRNDTFSAAHYEAAIGALLALRGRLAAQTDPEVWSERARFMAEERRVQVQMVDEALAALPVMSALEESRG